MFACVFLCCHQSLSREGDSLRKTNKRRKKESGEIKERGDEKWDRQTEEGRKEALKTSDTE